MVKEINENGLYSKTDLVDKTKVEQINILKNEIGLDNAQINVLNNEKKRVNKILQLQKPKDVTPPEVEKEPIEETQPEEEPAKEEAPIEEVIEEPAKETDVRVCDRCGNDMITTGGGPSGIDYYCEKCGSKTTVVQE